MASYADMCDNANSVNELLTFIQRCKRDMFDILEDYGLSSDNINPDRTQPERAYKIIEGWKEAAVEKLLKLLQ